MHAEAPRINGGIGFAIDGPRALVSARQSLHLTVADNRSWPMAPAERGQLLAALQRFSDRLSLRGGADIRVEGAMRTHVGLGSATAIRLAALEALALVNEASVDRKTLVEASGRGGTSGIGVNSYFEGGLICDLGRAGAKHFVPSSQAASLPSALALPSITMPNWPILLCLPRGIRPKTQDEEIDFFARTTPLSVAASHEASYVALFGLYASAAEADFVAFCRGVEQMQISEWKRAERAEYGDELVAISNGLRHAGAQCVGMSSLGPLLFCLAKEPDIANVTWAAEALNCEVREVRPTNRGRDLRASHA
jgi:beta-ribofuranosylaminobenzene 5'-phosphate synthase